MKKLGNFVRYMVAGVLGFSALTSRCSQESLVYQEKPDYEARIAEYCKDENQLREVLAFYQSINPNNLTSEQTRLLNNFKKSGILELCVKTDSDVFAEIKF